MKSNTSKKAIGTTSAPSMQIADALAYFEFATGYPEWTVDQASIAAPYLQEIGLTLIDGIGESVVGNDIELLKKCSMALRERLCFNIEEMRVPFQMAGPKVVSMMSPFQVAVLFGRLPLCEYLFNFALTMKGTVLRAGIDAPVPMICQLARHFPQAKPAEQAQIESMLQDFSEQLAASLAQTNPDQLNPASGMLFEPSLLQRMGLAAPMITAALQKQSALLTQQALQKATPQAPHESDSDPKHRL